MLFPRMLRKKHALTLLEVCIAIFLLGVLLSGLFTAFHQALKNTVSARELKQTVLQTELFQQRMKNLLISEKEVWIDAHEKAKGTALFTAFEQEADSDFDMCGELKGMLFLNDKQELCWVSWSSSDKARMEILLEKVDSFKCRLFDPKKGEWSNHWPKKKEEKPSMIAIDLIRNKETVSFAFFLKASQDKISYSNKL